MSYSCYNSVMKHNLMLNYNTNLLYEEKCKKMMKNSRQNNSPNLKHIYRKQGHKPARKQLLPYKLSYGTKLKKHNHHPHHMETLLETMYLNKKKKYKY